MNIGKVVASNQCTGCGACSLSCPVSCISMVADTEGFRVPSVNTDLCTDCGRCLRVCHTQATFAKSKSEGFILLNLDSKVCSKSSSGGAFSALAEAVLRAGGVAYGAGFDENLHVRHIRIDDLADLHWIQGSKYVQSELGSTFADVKRDLSSGVMTLFSGTPCQVAGLKTFLGRDYPNLLSVDLVCHGVPSPGFWDDYIAAKCAERSAIPIAVKFRLKTRWERGSYALSIKDTKGVVSVPALRDLYYTLFLKGLDFRESCYTCPYASMNRPGDITVGDCNSIEQYPDFMPTEVVSIALINNEKGKSAWASIEGSVASIPLDVEREAHSNAQLNHPFQRPHERDDIYLLLRNMSSEQLRARFLDRPSIGARIGSALRHLVPLKTRAAIKRLICGRKRHA